MWRAMASLLTLRDQVNALAPNRATGADGLVGDAAHQQTNSDHNPHDVEGVGTQIVSALDLTHDPAGGFDSYRFAEVLRVNRDRRIKYVISNHRSFNGDTWTWHAYSGPDPHTNHVHVSVNDDGPVALNQLSDTRTPWNLDGFTTEEDDMTPSQQYIQHVMNYRTDAILKLKLSNTVPAFTASDGTSKWPAFTEPCPLGIWTAQQTKSDDDIKQQIHDEIAAAVAELDDVTLTDEQITELAAKTAAGVTATIDVPTAQENAEAVLDAEASRLQA